MSNIDIFDVDGIHQTMRFRAYIKVVVNGKDVTNRLEPYLISVLVKDSPQWEATVELDDRDGRLDIPPFQSSLEIFMGWTSENSYRTFIGWVSDVEHGFGRKLGGRRMTIHGIAYQQSSMVKTPFQDHAGDGAPPGQMQGIPIPFAQAASQFGGNGGLSVSVGPTFAGTVRDYWSMNNESAMQWFARHADELGAMTRIEGSNVVFNGVDDFNKPNIQAVWGNNLISWRLRPFIARSMWAGSSQQYYDHMLGQWTTLATQFGLSEPFGGWASAIHSLPTPAPNAQVAQQDTEGDAQKAQQYFGDGRIMINGEPQASWGGTITMIGARPGVDGTYRILCADQAWSRQGYTTTCEVFPDVSGGNIGAGYTNVPVAGAGVTVPPASNQPQTVNNPDGSVTTFFPNGTITVQNALGITTTNPDGSEDFIPN